MAQLKFDASRIAKDVAEIALRECMYKGRSLQDWADTIKYQEPKRGHWKGFTRSRYFGNDADGEPIFRDGRFYVCSECERKGIIKTPYCPQCGAKMDEENEKEK